MEKWIELFNRQDSKGLAELYAEDAENYQMPDQPAKGKAAILRNFIESFRVVPDMGFKLVNMLESGDWVAIEWDGWGTFSEGARKKPYKLRGCGFFQVKNGKIVSQRGYWDKNTLYRQVGLPVG